MAPVHFGKKSTPSESVPKPPQEREPLKPYIGRIIMILGGWLSCNAIGYSTIMGKESFWSHSRPAWKSTLSPEESAAIDSDKKEILSGKNIRFRYFVQEAGKKTFQEIPASAVTKDFLDFKAQWADRFLEMFQKRPDLRNRIQNLTFEVKLFQAEALVIGKKDKNVAGLCDARGNMSFAMGASRDGLNDGYDGYEVVCHELSHFLDLLSDDGRIQRAFDGMLPGWNPQQKSLFRQARSQEKIAIQQGNSPMRNYALESDDEFLGVLVETYFEKPNALKDANPTLYHLMNDFFKQKRLDSESPSWVMLSLAGGGLMMISSLGLIFSGRPRGRKPS